MNRRATEAMTGDDAHAPKGSWTRLRPSELTKAAATRGPFIYGRPLCSPPDLRRSATVSSDGDNPVTPSPASPGSTLPNCVPLVQDFQPIAALGHGTLTG
ncbi:hypothetical protein SKAU_G00045670 [Synaphobranchus kaupii]|uniref:Uncharacterized protein n=1 Tax=Synaphobranchus kaupii TaxID=118154 RepID=A0A9Q1G213_SYNKA|nr:hypothetical protein SKAU_G00045670 [Synaphobranchus kaupii]